MKILEESLLRKTLGRSNAEVKFATLFGSYRRWKHDPFSDVDVFVVCGDEGDKLLIDKELTRSGFKANYKVHPNLFTSDDFESRLRRHDYLLASILDDSVFFFGDRDCFIEGKQRILKGKPNEESIRFNRSMGAKILGYANDCFCRLQKYGETSPFNHKPHFIRRELLLLGIQNYHLALGYLLASIEMRKLNKTISLRHLLTVKADPLLRDLISTEKRIRREAISQPHRTYARPDLGQEDRVQALSQALKGMMTKELIDAKHHNENS